MFRINEYVTKRNMSLELMNKRINYQGGNQQQRMINDKLRTLKKALLYSYQAATAILSDGRQFRCLINPDKNQPNYDNKEISIPYKDICLNKPKVGKTTQGQEQIGMKPGDVFTWKQTDTHWLVYLEYLEQDAYFRAEIRRCDQEVQINGEKYWTYIRGPVETSIVWNQKAGVEWNDLNHSLVMYITKDEKTRDYFYRFQTVKGFDPKSQTEKTWQVVNADPYYGDGIIQVFLDEYFENQIAEAAQKEKQNNESSVPQEDSYIDGPIQVTQYSRVQYAIKNASGGHWYLEWKGVEQDLASSATAISLDVAIGELGIFTLIYRTEDKDITLDVKIIAM